MDLPSAACAHRVCCICAHVHVCTRLHLRVVVFCALFVSSQTLDSLRKSFTFVRLQMHSRLRLYVSLGLDVQKHFGEYVCDCMRCVCCRGPDHVLGESHRQELLFQKGRQAIRKIEAFRSGLLLEHEVTDQLKAEEKEFRKRERANLLNALRTAKRRRVAAGSAEIDEALLQRARVYCGDDHLPDSCTAWMSKHSMLRVTKRKQAAIFIVRNAADPGRRVLWAAGLAGGIITTPSLKVFLVYREMLQHRNRRCSFWVSDAFANASPATAAIIRALVQAAPGWRLVARDEFEACCEAAVQARNKSRTHLFGLIKKGEAHGLGEHCQPRLFRESALLKLCARVDADRSVLGAACDR